MIQPKSMTLSHTVWVSHVQSGFTKCHLWAGWDLLEVKGIVLVAISKLESGRAEYSSSWVKQFEQVPFVLPSHQATWQYVYEQVCSKLWCWKVAYTMCCSWCAQCLYNWALSIDWYHFSLRIYLHSESFTLLLGINEQLEIAFEWFRWSW